MVNLKNLVSHRFRGFAEYENTLEGFKAALDYGVQNLEFDIRVSKCGTPMIYHDEHALDKNGKTHHLCNVMASDFKELGGTFARISTAEELFEIAGKHKDQSSKLLIDIKDAGFETEIHALVMLNKLGDRAVYVSWVPESIYAMYDLHPEADFCLSHWCKSPDAGTRKIHRVFKAKSGQVPRAQRNLVHGERSGWFIDSPLRGEMRDIVTSVCVPQAMVSKELVDNYQADGIEVTTFSYIDWDHIKSHEDQFKLDKYFIDNKKVFDELAS